MPAAARPSFAAFRSLRMFSALDGILLGVLLAHVLHDERGFRPVAALVGHRLAGPFLLLALVALSAFTPEDLRGWGRPTIQAAMTLFLASVVVREDHGLRRLLTARPLARVGALSYGLYLLHIFVAAAVESLVARRWLSPWLTFPASLAASFVLAELSFRLWETPWLRLKRRFSRAPAA